MNLNTLHKYYEEGWLIKQTHPTLPLTIWNYSQATQYEGKWDETTLQCRGLVTDDLGNVVARPFKKFFNIEEQKHTITDEFEVYEKMDGSLGIAFYYDDKWIFASRGSFTSDQAIKGGEMLLECSSFMDNMEESSTYLFEVIYPENRIVVEYEGEDLVLLGEIDTESGKECDISCYSMHITVVKKYNNIKNYKYLKQNIGENREGFVIKFSNGDRCKIKGEEYIRLHKIMTEISTKSVWECLSSGNDIYKILENVPDEFFNKIQEYVEELKSQYSMIEAEYTWIFNKLRIAYFKVYDREITRAEFAKLAKRYKYPQLLFKMLDDSDYSEAIWRIVKPEFKKL